MAAIEIDNLLDILQQKENDITVNDDTKEIIKILSAIKISKQQILRSYAQLSELPTPSLINKGNIYYVEAENGLYVSTGAAWLKIESTSLASFNVISGAPSGNGGLTYDNTTGEFIFNPADLSNKLELLDLSVCTNTASGNGNLSYNNHTGEFVFTPADLSDYPVTGALNNFICLTDLSICTNTASGNGGLTYDNTTGEFAFAPADIDSYFTNGNICNLYMTGTLCGPSTFTIDPAAHGDNTGTVVIAGNLQVDGVTTTVNSCTLEVVDKNIVLACGSVNAATSDGAGITADLGSDGSATLTYSSSNDRWEMNKSLATSVIGNVTGQVSDISNHSTTNLSEGTNLYYTDARVDARISASPGDNQKEFVASGDISAGDVVSVKNDGTVEKVKLTVVDPVLTPTSTNHPLSTPNIIKVIHNYNNNSVITIVPSGTSKIYVGTFSNGILNNNLYGETVNQTPQPITAVFDSHANRLIVAYVISGDGTNYPTLGIGIEVGEFDYGTGTVTFSTYRTWLLELDQAVANQYGVELTYDYNNNIPLLFVYGQNAMATDHFKVYQLDPLTTAGVDGIIKNADTNNPGNHTLVVDPGTQLMITSQSPSWEFIPTINAIFIVLKASGFSPPYFYLYGVESTATGMTYLGKKNLSPLNPTTGFLAADSNSGELALTYNEDNDSLLILGNAGSLTEDNLLGASITPINSWLTTYNDFVTVKSDYSSAQYRVMAKYNSTLQTYFLTYRISDILYARTAEIVNGVLEIHNDEQELYDYTGIFAQNRSGTSFLYGTDKTQPDTFIVNNQFQTQYITYTPGYTTTNADAWSGIAYTSGLDTENVIVTFTGAIDDNQTGLVKDTIYYVGVDGTLTSNKTEYGMIGKALSNTEIQIFGNTPIEFTQNIDIDFTNIDNKAVLTKTSTATYEFIKSSADSSQAYTAYEDISAGNLVSLRNDSTIELLKPNIIFTDGTRVATTKFTSGEYHLLTDRTNNRLIAINAMEDNLTEGHNQAGYIQFLEVTNNTIQELSTDADPSASWITTGGNASLGHSAVWIEHLSKGLVIYSNSGVYWKLFDYNNNQVNILATGTFTTNDDWYLNACYDETTGKVFVVRAFNSPQMMDTDQFAVHIMTVADDNTVTIDNGWQAIGQGLLGNFHYQMPKIAYNPDLNQLYVFFYELSGSVYRLWITDLTESIGFDTMSPMLTTTFTSQVQFGDLTNDGRGIHFLYHKLHKKLILWGHELNNRTNLTVISNLSNLTTDSPTEFQNGALVFTDHRFEDVSDNWWKGCEYDQNNGLLYLSQAVPSSYASNAVRKLYIVEVKGNNSINILDTLTVAPTTGDPTGYGFASSFNLNTNKLALFYDIEHPAATTVYYKLTSLDITASGTFFGIAEDNISANSNGIINLSGSVNRSQQGLSPNVSYYISSIGTLTSVPNGGKFLGTALSATELYIKQNQLNELTDVDFTTNTPTTTSGLVLTSDGDSTYSFQKVIGTNQKEFVATGTIATGDVVALRSDGTVEPVSDSISADSFGSAVPLAPFEINTQYTYDTTNNRYVGNGVYVGGNLVNYITVGQIDSANNTVINGSNTSISDCAISVSTYDSYNNRIVIAYVEISTGDGKYLVGEVNSSNNTITFGSAGTFATAINFTSNATALDITYDSYNKKIVICYVDGSNNDYTTVIVGEVNPTTNTLTLGTPTIIGLVPARLSTNTNPSVSMVFDPSRNHIAVCYTLDINPSNNFIVIDSFTTNSNNSITLMHSFGSQYMNIEVHGIQLLYDPSTTNYLVTYVDYTNNEYPTAVVCTYTSNGIIFNTPVVLATETFTVNYVDASFIHYGMRGVYSQAANKFIIAFDFTTSTKNEFIYGTITNNNTFTVDPIYDSAIDDGSHQGWLEDPVSLKLVFSYWDGGRTQQYVYTPKQISTNAGSWIGIAAENIADTATGLIDLPGAVNRSQTGLTTNSIYYVDIDGSVTTTPTIYGKIGRAYSATELQIFESYKQLNFASHLIFGN